MKKLLILLLLAAVLAFSACGSAVPGIDTVIAAEEPWPQEYAGLDRADLAKKWGAPKTAEESRDIWEKDGKFVVVSYENGKVVSVNRSSTLRAKVIELQGGGSLMTPCEGQWELNSANKIFFNPEWLSEPVEVGDILVMEYNGMIMETYPAQIARPYSIEVE